MNYGEIKKTDIANGEGVRVSLFVSGCTHHCKGCFNPETWNFDFGKPFDGEAMTEVYNALLPSHINGLTLLGGEPMEPENQRALLPFIRKLRYSLPRKDIWCYTGYTLETDLAEGGKAYCSATSELLSYIDVLVDGEFIEEKKNISLKFRGSENQRLIDLPKTIAQGSYVEYILK